MTRFFTNTDFLTAFMLDVVDNGENGKVYIPDMVVVELRDLAKAVIEVYGNKNTKLEVIGLRNGEKQHENLFLAFEKNIVTTLKLGTSDSGDNRLAVDGIKSWLEKYLV
jgi:FlaA1/EpsC-like NDP-sugar epimerase